MYSSPGRFVHLPLAYDHSALWVSLFYAQELVFPFPAASPPASRLPLVSFVYAEGSPRLF